MTDTKPEALRLAEMFDSLKMTVLGAKNALSMEEAATELRRLHEVNAELLEALKNTYPHIDNQALRFRIGSVIARCQESTKVFK